MTDFSGIRIAYVITGSFCTIKKSLEQMVKLKNMGAEIIPVLSENAAGYDTRFGTADELKAKIVQITGRKPLLSIVETEPIGPENYSDILVAAPCTSNTLAKIAGGINDTAATMAVKSHLRSSKPVVIAAATNDALSQSAENIGKLLNKRNFYFVPLIQDSPEKKPDSMVADFEKIPYTVEMALKHQQVRPLIYQN